MKANKLIDDIIVEPIGGAHNDHQEMANHLKEVILNTLAELNALDPQERINQRIEKFCDMGVVME
jgi:acetyl-CoA carboxylase carboxyl transferase subunit alpha